MKDQINPEHYKKSIETFDAISSQLSPMEIIGGLRWQILKYTMRFGSKENGTLDACLTDISKAEWYTNKLIQYLNDIKHDGSFIGETDNFAELFKKDK
jgi:hypothetical protein